MAGNIDLYADESSTISLFDDDESSLVIYPGWVFEIGIPTATERKAAETFGTSLYNRALTAFGQHILIRSGLSKKPSLLQLIYLLIDATFWLTDEQMEVCCEDFQKISPPSPRKFRAKMRQMSVLLTGSVVSILFGLAEAHRLVSGDLEGLVLPADTYDTFPCHTVLSATLLLELFHFRKVRVVRKSVEGIANSSSRNTTEPVLVTAPKASESSYYPLCTSIDLPLKDAYGSYSVEPENFGRTSFKCSEAVSGSVLDGLPLLCSLTTGVNAQLVTTKRVKVEVFDASRKTFVSIDTPVTMMFVKGPQHPSDTPLVWQESEMLTTPPFQNDTQSTFYEFGKTGEAVEKMLRRVFTNGRPVAGASPPAFQLVAKEIEIDN